MNEHFCSPNNLCGNVLKSIKMIWHQAKTFRGAQAPAKPFKIMSFTNPYRNREEGEEERKRENDREKYNQSANKKKILNHCTLGPN